MVGMPKPGGGMPAPATPQTFGDKRPAPAKMPVPQPKRSVYDKPLRKLKRGCAIPAYQSYRQTNGPCYLVRLRYNGFWITGIGDSEAEAITNMEQFYMTETAQGRADSVLA